MSDAIKSISLDDINMGDDSVQAVGVEAKNDKTKNRQLNYNPDYDNLANMKPLLRQTELSPSGPKEPEKVTWRTILERIQSMFGNVEVKKIDKKQQMILAGLAVVVVGAIAFYVLTQDDGPSGESPIEGAAPPAEAAAPAPEHQPKAKKDVPEAKVSVAEVPAAGDAVPVAGTSAADASATAIAPATAPLVPIPGNPYWKLPTPAPALAEQPKSITPQQTSTWRAMLAHPFSYQHHKAVEEMRKTKVEGSVAILYEALAQPKFWTRMEALISLAEQGVSIDTESMKTAIGNARSDLVRNYFRRFRKDYTDASVHIMHQALRVVDGHARLVILQILAQHRGELNDMYLIAGQDDLDNPTQMFAKRLMQTNPPSAATYEAYKKALAAVSDEASAPAPAPAAAKTTTKDIKVEKIPANMNVEEVYFIKDEEPVKEAPKPVAPKEDDGFKDLDSK